MWLHHLYCNHLYNTYLLGKFGCSEQVWDSVHVLFGVHVPAMSYLPLVAHLCPTVSQYFMMVGDAVQPGFVPWLPTSVISSPPVLSGTGSTTNLTLTDEESEVNALLLQLGPSEGRRGSLPPGEAVGGLVSCYLCPFSQDPRDVGGAGEGEKRMSQMQRIAARCHCNVYYVTYGGQVEVHANPENFISVGCHGYTVAWCTINCLWRWMNCWVCKLQSSWFLSLLPCCVCIIAYSFIGPVFPVM